MVASNPSEPYYQNYLPIMQQSMYQILVYQPPIYQLQSPATYQLQPPVIYQPQQLQTPPPNPAQMTLGNPRSENSETRHTQNPNSQHYLSLLVTPEDTTSNNPEPNQKQPLISNISPATISNNKSLAAIFPFKLEETTPVPLFSRVTLDTKPITVMYTNAKVDSHAIKLILDSRSAGSIITKQLMNQLGYRVDHAANIRIITANRATKTPIGKIDNFLIEVNDITVPIKVLVIEAT
ncbi:hypothetical protein G9A89_006294 [Geosiphon pyriformis]|nr:hypothetical protein G9A89_006294 [Geosiphon pyriformis]